MIVSRTTMWPLALLVAAEAARVTVVPLAVLLGILGVATAAGLVLAPVMRERPGFRLQFLVLAAIFGVIVVMPAVLPLRAGVRVFEAGHAVAPLLAMTAVIPWLPWRESEVAIAPQTSFPWWAAGVLSIGLVIAFHWGYVGRYGVVTDEGGYLMQAGWLQRGNFGMPIPAGTEEFFASRHSAIRDGVLYGQYAPGWPALVAAFSAVGLRQWIGAVLAALAVGSLWRLGRAVANPVVATLAVLLLCSSAWFVGLNASWMSHAPGFVAYVVAALCLVRAERATGRSRWLSWTGAGIALGAGFAVRPLTGLCMAATLMVWRLLVSPDARASWVRSVPWLALGGLPLAAFVMSANVAVSGSPTTFGYTVVHGPHHDLGFGPRGYLLYNDLLERVPSLNLFDFQQALANGATNMRDVFFGFVPLFTALPLMLAALTYRVRVTRAHVLPFLLLPVVHFFYWFSDVRFVAELLPFLCLGVAYLLWRVWSAQRELVYALLFIMVVGSWTTLFRTNGNAGRGAYAETPWREYQPRGFQDSLFRHVEILQRDHGPLLLFSRDSTSLFDAQLARLMQFNGAGESGPVLVVRDRGARNSLLISRYAGRTPFLVVRTKVGPPQFVPLSAPATRPNS